VRVSRRVVPSPLAQADVGQLAREPTGPDLALDDIEPEHFADLDEAFYALEASGDVDEVMRDLTR
jgi:hypothetical protein